MPAQKKIGASKWKRKLQIGFVPKNLAIGESSRCQCSMGWLTGIHTLHWHAFGLPVCNNRLSRRENIPADLPRRRRMLTLIGANSSFHKSARSLHFGTPNLVAIRRDGITVVQSSRAAVAFDWLTSFNNSPGLSKQAPYDGSTKKKQSHRQSI